MIGSREEDIEGNRKTSTIGSRLRLPEAANEDATLPVVMAGERAR